MIITIPVMITVPICKLATEMLPLISISIKKLNVVSG